MFKRSKPTLTLSFIFLVWGGVSPGRRESTEEGGGSTGRRESRKEGVQRAWRKE